jgi:hypothetical protein
MSLSSGAQIAIAVCATAGAVALLGGAVVFWRRRAARRNVAGQRRGKRPGPMIHEVPGSSSVGVASSPAEPEPRELWAPHGIHELPASRMESPLPVAQHHRDFSFATVGTQQHQCEREDELREDELREEELRDQDRARELQEQYRRNLRHLSPDASPEEQAVSPIDRSSTTRSGGSRDNARMHPE